MRIEEETLRKRRDVYFPRSEGAPAPVAVEIKRRVHFSEVDPMGVVWHGRYPTYFEEASEELGRHCDLSYKDFYEAKLRAPIVRLHVDYHNPLSLGEEFTARALLIWNEGARLNTEYYLIKEDGSLGASGYTVQLFTAAGSGEVCLIIPRLLQHCRTKWMAGDFHLQR
ncbi:MAG: acyl-CoA thioesterase [Pseudomonadota bacterium]